MRRAAAFALLGTMWVSTAFADTRHTVEAVTLRKKAGEKEAAVATIPAGAEVTVIKEEGRWVQVKYEGHEGYVTRTTLDGAVGADAKPEGKWSAPRGEERALFVQTRAAASLASTPRGSEAAKIEAGTRLAVTGTDETTGWLHVRDDAGHEGWLDPSRLDNSARNVDISSVDLHGTTETYTRPPARPFRLDAALGYRSLGMDMSANADGGLANYLVAADAAAIVLDGDATRAFGKIKGGVDVRVVASKSAPGIDYPGPTQMAGKIPFSTFALDAGVRGGYGPVSLRVGAHYDAFLPDSVDNAGSLPRERLIGLTAGARVELAPPHSRLGATVRLDVLAIGSRAQTPGLEDGTSSTARAVWGGATVRYLLGRVSVFAAYDLGRASTEWTGMSERQAGVTGAHRVDVSQLLQLGVGASL